MCCQVWSRLSSTVFFANPEIEDLDVPAFVDDKIRGLDIAVDNAAGVRLAQRRSGLNRDIHRHTDAAPTLANNLGNSFAFNKLHCDKRDIAGLIDLVYRADVRVIHCRGGPGLAKEAVKVLAVRANSAERNFSAALRPRLRSSARKTSPMPPEPSTEIILYSARFSPIVGMKNFVRL